MSEALTKVCRGCGEVKTLDAFKPVKLGRLGRDARCRLCRNPPKPKPLVREGYKLCTGCDVEKPYEEFHKQAMGTGGRESKCKTCKKKSDALRYSKGGEGIARVGCNYPYDCRALGPTLCRPCTQKIPSRLEAHREKMRRQASDDEWRRRVFEQNRDAQFQERRIAAIKTYYESRRDGENEEFETFMRRMEREERGMNKSR